MTNNRKQDILDSLLLRQETFSHYDTELESTFQIDTVKLTEWVNSIEENIINNIPLQKDEFLWASNVYDDSRELFCHRISIAKKYPNTNICTIDKVVITSSEDDWEAYETEWKNIIVVKKKNGEEKKK